MAIPQGPDTQPLGQTLDKDIEAAAADQTSEKETNPQDKASASQNT